MCYYDKTASRGCAIMIRQPVEDVLL